MDDEHEDDDENDDDSRTERDASAGEPSHGVDEERAGVERGRPDAVVDLIKRLVTVSVRTQELVASLPKLEIPANA